MISINFTGHLSAVKRLQLLQLPVAKRRKILGGIGREIKRQSIRNLRAQQDVEGNPWAARKRGNNRKLLRRLNRQVAANIVTGDSVQVGFKGRVAYQQHEGITHVMNAAAMQREGRGNTNDDPATKKQAKALRAEGYKIKVKGSKKWRSPSLKWIVQNIAQKQAGLILRILRDQAPKKAWVINVPARQFLGATDVQINKMTESVYDNTINSRA